MLVHAYTDELEAGSTLEVQVKMVDVLEQCIRPLVKVIIEQPYAS